MSRFLLTFLFCISTLNSCEGLAWRRPYRLPGFIITGGDNSASEKRVEIFNPITRRACPLPYLPKKMLGHSQCGNLLCSGRSCLKMNSTGSFSPAPVRLLQKREYHLCWSLPGGRGEVMLLGGGYSEQTTEVISSNFDSTKPSWDLKYKTRKVFSQLLSSE